LRAGPLSDDKVIAALNSCYVPVYTSNEDYEGDGKTSKEEKDELRRVYHGALKAKMPAGSVCTYLLGPDGTLVDSLGVVRAMEPGALLAMLERNAEKLGLKKGEPVVKPRPQAAPSSIEAGAILLHLVAPYEQRHGSWREFPAETWLALGREEQAGLFPSKAETGATWEIDKAVTTRLYNYFYPATEDTKGNQIDRNKIEEQSLKGTVLSVHDGVVRARLDGSLRMGRKFYPGHPEQKPNYVEARIAGLIEFVPGKEIRSFRLVTEKATYGDSKFAVAVRLVPRQP
jgi:hypothetical protein